MRYVILFLTCLMLGSCASLNPFDKPQLELNANVGKNVEQEKNQVKVEAGNSETKQEAEKITNDNNYIADKIENVTQQFSKEVMMLVAGLVAAIIFLAGWAIPTPKECFNSGVNLVKTIYFGIRYVIADILNTFIVYPIKSVGDFILKMLSKDIK